MKKKYKMTGCARFFIVLLFLAPLAYLGASYFNGEDGIENIKKFLNIGQDNQSSNDSETYSTKADDLQEKVDELEKENRKLRREVNEKEAQIKALQKIKSSEGE